MKKQIIRWFLKILGEDMILREYEADALKKALEIKDEQLKESINRRPGDAARSLRDHNF